MEESKLRGITLRRVVSDKSEETLVQLTRSDIEMISAGLMCALKLAADRAVDDQIDVPWSLITRFGEMKGIVEKNGAAVVGMDPVSVDISHKLFGL